MSDHHDADRRTFIRSAVGAAAVAGTAAGVSATAMAAQAAA